MTHPLGTIKDLATGTLTCGASVPARLASRAFGVTRSAVQVGQRVARDASGRGPVTMWDTADQPAQRRADVAEPISRSDDR